MYHNYKITVSSEEYNNLKTKKDSCIFLQNQYLSEFHEPLKIGDCLQILCDSSAVPALFFTIISFTRDADFLDENYTMVELKRMNSIDMV